jgi:predicted DNA-binding transcriptional regulator AlpA
MSESTRPCHDCTMTVQYMGPAEVAAYVTRVYRPLTSETVRQYAAKGRMPEPDVRIGPNAGWSEATIDEWWANRPGRGARTDLAKGKK